MPKKPGAKYGFWLDRFGEKMSQMIESGVDWSQIWYDTRTYSPGAVPDDQGVLGGVVDVSADLDDDAEGCGAHWWCENRRARLVQ